MFARGYQSNLNNFDYRELFICNYSACIASTAVIIANWLDYEAMPVNKYKKRYHTHTNKHKLTVQNTRHDLVKRVNVK